MNRLIILTFVLLSTFSFGQNKPLKLTNAVIIGQFDKPEERYNMEAFMAELLAEYKVKTTPSLNYLKAGETPTNLLNDSLQTILKAKEFDTYMTVGVRGYDRTFRPVNYTISLNEKLDQGTLREIYRQGAVSVTFEFSFFKGNELIRVDYFKVGNISDKDTTLKKLRKKLPKLILSNWK